LPASTAISAGLLKDKPQILAGGKLTSYDPEKSGFCLMLMTKDETYFPQYWDLAAAFGHGTGRSPLERHHDRRITSGEHLLGFNVIGSYVVLRRRRNPDLGLVYPSDYVLVMSRVAFIPRNAKASECRQAVPGLSASARAPDIMANQATLFALREDVEGPYWRPR